MSGPSDSTAVAATIDAVARFTGKSPLVTARAPRGGDVPAALWQHRPGTRRFEGHQCDILGVMLRGNAMLEQLQGGRSIWRGPAPGSIVLLRSSEPTDWHLEGEFEMLQIYLPASTGGAGGGLDLIDRPFRDPLLLQLARSAWLALTESNGSANYLQPLLESVQRCFEERIVRQGSDARRPHPEGLSGHARRLVMALIDAELHRDLPVEELAATVGLSPRHFSRAFKASFNFTPHQYVLEQRVAKAASLLSTGDLDMSAICRACGFSGPGHFSAEFKKRKGTSPTAYRKRH